MATTSADNQRQVTHFSLEVKRGDRLRRNNTPASEGAKRTDMLNHVQGGIIEIVSVFKSDVLMLIIENPGMPKTGQSILRKEFLTSVYFEAVERAATSGE